ncbi:hypothetical protein OROMI_006663 [Orobanche minor]
MTRPSSAWYDTISFVSVFSPKYEGVRAGMIAMLFTSIFPSFSSFGFVGIVSIHVYHQPGEVQQGATQQIRDEQLQVIIYPNEHFQISAEEAGKPVDQSLYRKLIRSLLYLIASRPDIQFAVGVFARYQVTPKESHFFMAKRILKYVKGTVDAGLWYPKEGVSIWLATSTRISVKQLANSLSTAESEYYVAGSCCMQILWMQQQLSDYGISAREMPIMCDSMSAIAITHNPVLHSRTKHIDRRHHFIRNSVENKDVRLEKVHIDIQLADIFTKPLSTTKFCMLHQELESYNPTPYKYLMFLLIN